MEGYYLELAWENFVRHW